MFKNSIYNELCQIPSQILGYKYSLLKKFVPYYKYHPEPVIEI